MLTPLRSSDATTTAELTPIVPAAEEEYVYAVENPYNGENWDGLSPDGCEVRSTMDGGMLPSGYVPYLTTDSSALSFEYWSVGSANIFNTFNNVVYGGLDLIGMFGESVDDVSRFFTGMDSASLYMNAQAAGPYAMAPGAIPYAVARVGAGIRGGVAAVRSAAIERTIAAGLAETKWWQTSLNPKAGFASIGKPTRIALGRGLPFHNDGGLLENFAENVNAKYFKQWDNYKDFQAGGIDLRQLIKSNIQNADEIFFNLDQFDISKFKAFRKLSVGEKKSAMRQVQGVTNWELEMIVSDPALFNRTTFFTKNGRRLTLAEARQLIGN